MGYLDSAPKPENANLYEGFEFLKVCNDFSNVRDSECFSLSYPNILL